jgi:hypothetical protein
MWYFVVGLVILVIVVIVVALYSRNKKKKQQADIDSRTVEAEIFEGESTTFEKVEKVFEATYGAGEKFIDLTDKVNQAISSTGTLTVTANNEFAGQDPVPGVRKSLKITYLKAK